MIVVTGLAMAGAIYIDEIIIAAILGLGMAQAWYLVSEPSGPRPMGALGAAVTLLGFSLTVIIHASTAAVGLVIFLLSGWQLPSWF